MDGLTYYKFESTYEGDKTKYCSLDVSDIEQNFNFLRGKEVKDVSWDGKKDSLSIVLLDGTVFDVRGIKTDINESLTEDIEEYKSSINMDGTYFDDETCILHLKINGKEYLVNGFDNANQIYTDDTLSGSGTILNPLSISRTNISGYHLPANGVIDVSEGETLPSLPKDKAIYITKENVSKYGVLYNYEGIQQISDYLKSKGSKWRIPSSHEWGEILNYAEHVDKQEHTKDCFDDILGEQAGLMMKSRNGEWSDIDEDVLESNMSYNFDVYPSGFANSKKELINFGEEAMFWTSDTDGENAVSICFSTNVDGVIKRKMPVGYYGSLRLVKDYNNDFYPVELFDGMSYETTLMKGVDESGVTTNYIWTKDNISLKNIDEDNYIVINDVYENEISGNTRFFINSWNGEFWDKKELLDGEVVTLYEYDGYKNEEWVVINNNLIRKNGIIFDSLKNKFYDLIDERNEGILSNIKSILDDIIKIEKDINNTKATVDKMSSFLNSIPSNIKSSLNELNKKTDDTAKKLDNNINKTKSLSTDLENVEKSVERTQSALASNRFTVNSKFKEIDNAINDLSKKIGCIDNTLKNYDDNIGERVDDINSELAKLNVSVNGLNKSLTELLNTVDEIQNNLEDLKNNSINFNKPYTINSNGGLVLETYDETEVKIKFDGNFGNI